MKGRRARHNEDALKPKAKGKASSCGKISRPKKGGRCRKEQVAGAAMEREGMPLENTSEVIDIGAMAVPEVVVGAMDDLGNGWCGEEGPWWTNVVDDQEISWGWGSAWLPFCDVEFSAEARELLFWDVGWDDSLWNFDVEPGKTHPQPR
ncbi:hypothetical protein MLD38_007515 [Melastoma candidum]|uniref:Uncharacterized protein n=1 Tax=Melastoma candidum TaxID=119954 RepID=A0ACB9RRB9_9MYRT|nr:hypothetical protein MLD38_007515 [Melastoma candidum]